MESLKKKRTAKFSHGQNCILVSRVVSNWDQLYGSQSRKLSYSRKGDIWQSIVQEVNAAGEIARNVDTCRRRINDIRQQVKKKLAYIARHQRGTGGGPPANITFSCYEEELKGCLGPDVVSGVPGEHDSDVHMLGEPSATTDENVAEDLNQGNETLLLFDDDDNTQITFQTENEENCGSINDETQAGPSNMEPPVVCDEQQGVIMEEELPTNNEEGRHQASIPAPGPIRVPRGRRRRELLAQRQEEANSASMLLANTLNSMSGNLRERQQQHDQALEEQRSFHNSLITELRRHNESQEAILKEMEEEQKKMSSALFYLVGSISQQLPTTDQSQNT
ncbi:uncharacterized protein LOC143997117 isoform X1 [Lithobates pipiens]